MELVRALFAAVGIVALVVGAKYSEFVWRCGWACLATAWFLPTIKAGL